MLGRDEYLMEFLLLLILLASPATTFLMVFHASPPRITWVSSTGRLWWLFVLSHSHYVWQTGVTSASELPLQASITDKSGRETERQGSPVGWWHCVPRFPTSVPMRVVVSLWECSHEGGFAEESQAGWENVWFQKHSRSLAWSVILMSKQRCQQQGR